MSTASHDRPSAVPERRRLPARQLREMWAGLAIGVIWVTVLLDALFGPDIVSNNANTNTATVPSAVVIALFATLATWVVAKYGLGSRKNDAD